MSRYLIWLPAPDAEWATVPPEEHAKGMRSHGRSSPTTRDVRAAVLPPRTVDTLL